MTELIGQCLDCGLVYEPATHAPLPEQRQPPATFDSPERQRGLPLRRRTSYAGHREEVSVWEGREVSHGYCRNCDKRDAWALQAAGPEQGAKMLGKSQEEAAAHWWWMPVGFPKRRKRE